MEKEKLILKAKEARKLSYSPYSHFAVGAALLTKDGKVYLGANIENSSYPLCMCAERNALYNAMMDGYKKEDFVALALSLIGLINCSIGVHISKKKNGGEVRDYSNFGLSLNLIILIVSLSIAIIYLVFVL